MSDTIGTELGNIQLSTHVLLSSDMTGMKKSWIGTQSQYDDPSLIKNEDTIYFVVEDPS